MPDIVVQDNGAVTVVVTDEPVVTLVDADGGAAQLTSSDVEVREIDVVGIKGDKGDKGDQGDRGEEGPPGASAINPVVFTQEAPLSVWTVVHSLNTYPLVTVVDSANQTVMGDISYLDLNTVRLTFSAPFSGTAYLI